ncbi:hypothetical protein IFR05_013388 [Cadophora sp. M221]|nr:hypothetical protein IFR05_013388 [Cadophora sp. M221]
MTRDTHRAHDDREALSDADIYAALWATAPFPRLPADAPDGLRLLTVEVDDPKRIYGIHRARRRHNFQLLVERTSIVQTSDIKDDGKEAPKAAPKNGAFVEDLPDVDSHTGMAKPTEKQPDGCTEHNLSILEDPVNTDPRSFVQNVFGTVAFKMVEWLTPRNLATYAQFQRNERAEQSNTLDTQGQQSGEVEINLSKSAQNPANVLSDTDSDIAIAFKSERPKSIYTPDLEGLPPPPPPPVVPKSQPIISKDVPSQEAPHNTVPESKPQVNSVTRSTPGSNRRKKSDMSEPPNPKGILTKPQKSMDAANDPMSSPPTNLASMPKHKIPRQTLITSPKMHMSEFSSPVHEIKEMPTKAALESFEAPKAMDNDQPSRSQEPSDTQTSQVIKSKELQISEPQPAKNVLLPQSLSLLSIESINFLCDIMQDDGMSEKHLLRPESIEGSSIRIRDAPPFPFPRNSTSRRPSFPSRITNQWKVFIEQSFFDVLGKPDSLLKSFTDEEAKLLDSQTIWYLMLRLTRVSPSLVFDSLWSVTGTLFRPPKQLEDAYEWAKDDRSYSRKAVSDKDAAWVVSICLHALVAAAPSVSDARQMGNMSRIRSYGLAMLGRESSSLEPVDLCLAYEDAFTNEPAFRLARRLFAAIPTRRRFTELLDLQKGTQNGDALDSDVLEMVLESLKFLDLGSTPIIYFTDDERDLHEKRVPTLIIDWARAVMLQEWQGSAEVPNDGPFGGALAMMAAIYKSRKSLLLGDIHFRTEYFAERLDPSTMPLDWLSYSQNKKSVHLLDYPYLFNPSTLVTYFRAINYSRMNQSYERAHTTGHLVSHFMSEGSLVTDKYRRDKLHDRLRTATSEFLVLEIRRTSVLLDTFNAIWRREERELMRPLKVRLGEEGGEEGLDSGGVQQEFFRLAIAEALNPDYGTFTIDSRTKMAWFLPGSPEPLWKFELMGMIVSLAVYNGLTLPVTFPKALYRKLLDEEVTELHHIADGWPDLANGLTSLLEWDEKDGLVEDIFARTYEFSVEQFGQPVSREMGASTHWPQFSELHSSSNPLDAPLVTNENRNNYVSDYIRWLTDISIQPQFEAFKKGFFSCVDKRSITLFDPETLQSVVEGIQEIDISDLRRATRYIGWDASHRSIRDFWSIVKRYDLTQKRKLLEFVTASDRVPVGGMRNLQFTLQRNGIDDGHLPSSYTCYGILLLPEYSSKDVLREKLAMALENSKGFGFA